MPGAWRVHVIHESVRAAGVECRVRECDLYSLQDEQRRAVLDAMLAEGTDLPAVLVGGTVACTGGIVPDEIVAVALRVQGT